MEYLILSIIFVILILLIFLYIMKKDMCIEKEFSNIETNCLYRRWGCCNDKITPRLDPEGTNCRGF